jgi:hypothetical protein
MGCDIHMVVQVRDGDSWHTQDMHGGHVGRNYSLFAILADVRNGLGFAGCDTGDRFESIAPGRGLPKDFALSDDDWLGEHSFTWMLLSEIEAFDWNQKRKHRGWISGTELKRMRDAGETRPQEYCGGISGGRINHVSIQELESRIQESPVTVGPVTLNDIENYYAVYEWETTYAEACENFVNEWLPRLHALGNPEDVRLVMGFDS